MHESKTMQELAGWARGNSFQEQANEVSAAFFARR